MVDSVVWPARRQCEDLILTRADICRQAISDKWLVVTNFNMILQATDKSNSNLNRRIMGEWATAPTCRGVRFQSFCPKIKGYQEAVSAAWTQPFIVTNPFLHLNTKMAKNSERTAALGQKKRHNKLLLLSAKEFIGTLVRGRCNSKEMSKQET
jgi:hypothetical protein